MDLGQISGPDRTRGGLGADTGIDEQVHAVIRRPLPGSPFNVTTVARPVEQFELNDRVSHDRFGLGSVIGIEPDVAVLVDFGARQERLADAYADHLLPVVASELPAELQSVFREVEERMAAGADDDGGDDPFRAAADQLSDDEARALIERIVALFGRLASGAAE